jgi:signal transduction histidine kinase
VSRLSAFVRSIRFRLSILYSSVVFALGAGVLGVTYYFVQRSLRRLPLTFDSRLAIVNGRPIIVQDVDLDSAQLMEQAFTQRALSLLADNLIFGLVLLFLLSLVVGWVIAGRALRPVAAITAVARDIQASDLSRRIAYSGPDDELGRLAATFDDMLERLDAAFHTQRRFLADTSHDLRTPLAVIRSNIDVLADDPDATLSDWKEAAGIVQRNAERMGSMIDDLLAAARLEARAAARVELDLADLVAEAATELRPKGAESDVDVMANPLPAPIEGVAESLRRAIANLADNAMKAAPIGSKVVLASGTSDGWAWVVVADEGTGIDPAVAEGRSGPGLGLSIVRQVVEAHGGTLAAHPSAERGTTMVMWLPAAVSPAPPPDESPLQAV